MTESATAGLIKYDQAGNKYKFSNGRWRIFEDRSVGANIAAGAGEQLTSIGRGAVGAVDFLPGVAPVAERMRGRQAAEAEQRQFLSEDAPIASNVGRALPFAATAPLAAGSVPAALGIAGIDATLGALGAEEGQRLEGAAFGGLSALGGFGLQAGARGLMASRVQRNIEASGQTIAEGAARGAADVGIEAAEDFNEITGFLPGSVGSGQVGDVPIGGSSRFGDAKRMLKIGGESIAGRGVDSPAHLQAFKVLRENGFQLRPGSLKGNFFGQAVFDQVERNPLLGNIVQDMVAQPNNQALNKMIYSAMGDELNATARVSEFTSGSISNLKQAAGDLIEAIQLDAGVIKPSKKIIADMGRIAESYSSNFKVTSKTDPIVKRLGNITKKAQTEGGVPAKDWLELRSDVRDEQLKKHGGENRALQSMVAKIDEALEDALEANTEVKYTIKDYRVANTRFRLARALDKPGVLKTKDGNIEPGALARNLKAIFKAEWGQNDRFNTFKSDNMGDAGNQFRDLFDVVKALQLQPRVVNDSGTATRLSVNNLINEPTLTAGTLAARGIIPRWIKNSQLSPEELQGLIDNLPR